MLEALPHIEKPPQEWTVDERWAVICNRYEWIQRCLEHYEEEMKLKRFVDFCTKKS